MIETNTPPQLIQVQSSPRNSISEGKARRVSLVGGLASKKDKEKEKEEAEELQQSLDKILSKLDVALTEIMNLREEVKELREARTEDAKELKKLRETIDGLQSAPVSKSKK